MKVLVGCEFSGIVRDAFIAQGHEAWSCDIIPTEAPGPHIINDVRNVLDSGWDLMVAHPPCQYLTRAGIRWLQPDTPRWRKMLQAIDFFNLLLEAPIPMIAIENPIMHRHARDRLLKRYDEIVNPCDFGDSATKATCLWLKNLPPLMATMMIIDPFVNWAEFGYRSSKDRSRTFPGLAAAMAAQWGGAV